MSIEVSIKPPLYETIPRITKKVCDVGFRKGNSHMCPKIASRKHILMSCSPPETQSLSPKLSKKNTILNSHQPLSKPSTKTPNKAKK